MPEDFRAKLGVKQIKFDEDSLTKEKKGNKTTILKCPIVATIFFVYKIFSTTKTYRFILLCQNVDNFVFSGIKKMFVEMKSQGKQLKL